MRRTKFVLLFTAALCLLGLHRLAPGADYILTAGGGPSPQYNQISLEKNVLYFQKVLAAVGLSKATHDIFFTDGNPRSRNLEFTDPAAATKPESAVEMIYTGDPDSGATRFGAGQIPSIQGPNTPEAIAHWFDTTGKTLKPGDRLLFYFTGHGGPTRQPRNTVMDMWNDTGMTTTEFIAQLDKLNPDVKVTLVMVQCFSGGFANVIYNGGDPSKGLSKAKRCGFFATLANRPAAGCTPDISEEDYHEFSTYFWAAICGKTRTGKAVPPPDYNHDGKVTMDEACAYTRLVSDTIDIPVTTSDQLLRDFSKVSTRRGDGLLAVDGSYQQLLAAASPSQNAVLEGLSRQLHLDGDARVADARTMEENAEKDMRKLDRTEHDAQRAFQEARLRIKRSISLQWPQLDKSVKSGSVALIASDGPAIVAAIEHHPSYQALLDAQQKLNDADDTDDQLERRSVKVQRFLYCAQTVALADNLPKVAPPDIIKAYHALTTREAQSLAP